NDLVELDEIKRQFFEDQQGINGQTEVGQGGPAVELAQLFDKARRLVDIAANVDLAQLENN
ncbi:MAG TPA: hypothetical protein DCZ13_05920, partial [Porticoccaceae bacterium]|nr:hypothetical protein [Porticoccaceae bacterium]